MPIDERRRPDWADLPYASQSEAQKLDIYLPADRIIDKPLPVIIAIHGGAFAFGDKADNYTLAPILHANTRGYAVVSINYRLSGEAQFPAPIYDVKAAIRFLRANASTYQLDPDRIALWGESAGGSLAALAGTSGGIAALEDLSMGNGHVSSRVQAVVDWYGPIQFDAMDDQFRLSGIGKPDHGAADSPESRYLGGTLADVPDLVRQASAQTYVAADAPPFFIQHGTADVLIPVEQSMNFAAALERAIGADQVALLLLEGAGHGGPAFTSPDNTALVLAFLGSHLRGI
ncbi:conserved hypothetical protein [Paenibacillus curdlanolyticus YK9]|uniref:BD-FAE-like domain-containing protein n=1 Tax=Paenibacillus curdlanolyticus YK9 TaxID=717606 RepID=E0IDK2_9BACL|nr:alpha/beta hydrolase [Paenibacillus curdlanolyticus]EFM09657.1 conserved hypothetical protein [Paenibacillus curdlanolyticus YK9]